MNKKTLISTLVVVLIGTGLYLNKRPTVLPVVLSAEELLVLEKARGVLLKTDAPEDEIYEAMHRLARAQDPAALNAALQNSQSASRNMREGAVNALGYFSDDATLSKLESMLDDPEQNVRIRTLQALSNAKSDARVLVVQKYLTREGLSDREVVIGHSVLIKVAKSEEQLKNSVDFLVEYAARDNGTDNLIAFSKLVELVPNDNRVRDLARSKIFDGKKSEFIDLGLRYLAQMKDAWVTENMSGLLKSKDEQVQVAAIGTLHQVCPKNSWEILKSKFYSEKSTLILSGILREASRLGGADAKDFILQAIKSGRLTGESLVYAKSLSESGIAPQAACVY